ncbi:class I SAM-dependent methyltransferase [Mycobacterium nebraskense]|uniref:class I SAM-dependent methyltransferase n=1 Tax=Mycobacterium nebraskense TaxID=244292 RepID=UPI0021F38FD1|nr:methyltransferase domain-containing protein [Mycobacterium nebraskense]
MPFDDASFDTVVCTFGLCAIPDIGSALDEIARVRRPSGRLILVDHVASSSRVARDVERAARGGHRTDRRGALLASSAH